MYKWLKLLHNLADIGHILPWLIIYNAIWLRLPVIVKKLSSFLNRAIAYILAYILKILLSIKVALIGVLINPQSAIVDGNVVT